MPTVFSQLDWLNLPDISEEQGVLWAVILLCFLGWLLSLWVLLSDRWRR